MDFEIITYVIITVLKLLVTTVLFTLQRLFVQGFGIYFN